MKRFFKRLFWVALAFFVARAAWNHWGNPDTKETALSWWEQKDKSSTDEPTPETTGKTEKIPRNRFEKIDRHARNAPASAEVDVASLASYLEKGCKSDLEKARAIYVWIAENVSYDDESYNSGGYGATHPEGVLEARTAVCSGFSALYQALGEAMGLEIKTVSGYAKGYSYTPGKKLTKSDHAWNLIRIDGEWHIFDATWGQGSGTTENGKLRSTKKFDEFWFDADPYAAIFNHYPEDAENALVEPLITLEQYENFPKISSAFFKLGFDAQQTYQAGIQDPYVIFPMVFDHNIPVQVVDAPSNGVLQKGVAYHFKFYAPEADHAAISGASRDWTFLKKERGNFYIVFKPQRTGTMSINFKKGDKEGRFETVLLYKISDSPVAS